MNEKLTGALDRLSTGGKVLLALPERGRALVRRVPEPIQLEFKKYSSRGAHVCREIFAGILVVGLVAIILGYGRLSRGPISLPTLVPTIEAAINGQLSDLHVKIDDAVLQRDTDGPGVLFRLRNIRLIDSTGSIVAQAPLAAIALSGSALLSGRIAPGSVDFIGPRLLLFYNSDQGLSLSFSQADKERQTLRRGPLAGDESRSSEAVPARPETVIAKRLGPQAASRAARQLNVTETITEVFERARRGNTSYLTRFGVKDAIVVLHRGGTETLWELPDFAIDLEHRGQRSVLLGKAKFASKKGDWQLSFSVEQRPRRQSLAFTAMMEDLVPSSIAEKFPNIAALQALDIPVTGEINVELSSSGEFLSGDAKLRLRRGHITPPWDPESAMWINRGDLRVHYSKETDVVEIAPSTLRWGKSRATISGEFRPVREGGGAPKSWNFKLKASEAVLAVKEFGLDPVPVDEWVAEGNIAPEAGRLTLSRFVIRSGQGSIALAGSIVDAPGSPEVNLTGTISPMPLDLLKQFWPKFLAGKARSWVGERVSGGQVLGGTITIALKPGELAQMENGGSPPPGVANVGLDLSGLSIVYKPKLPPLLTGNARLSVSGIGFALDVPQAKIALASGEEIALTEGRFLIPDLRQDPQQGEISFKAAAATSSVLKLLDHEPLGYMQEVGMKPESFGGTAQGAFTMSMPMVKDLDFKDIKLRGSARLEDAIAAGMLGDVDVQGGSLDVNLTEQAVEVEGEVTIRGVPSTLAWQHLFHTQDEPQPPIRISAILDEGARAKLGMEVNHMVRGDVPVTLSIARSAEGRETLSMLADLTESALILSNVGWTKPKGRAATVQFDVVQGEDGSTELKNLKILGDDIAIEGTMSLDADQRLKSFYFSDFSFDRLTHMEVSATLKEGNILDVQAHGPSYNGKQFFESLFSAGQLAEDEAPVPDDAYGIDLSARIGTVLGFYDTTVRDLQVTLKKRQGRLVALDVEGQLNGKASIAARLETNNGARTIRAEAHDAGAVFRLIGFYPNVNGGEATLQVNLDTGEPGTKSGTLWARNFELLGDSVVRDVLADPGTSAALGQHKRRAVRRRIAFNKLHAPFTVGKRRFYLRDAYMNGPALGATMRGTVDFKSGTVDLGGTYIPLYGLNSALGAIPILGRVLVGRQGEGVVGITFAIKGKLEDPAVLINPMSVMTPGIFRQIFEFGGTGAKQGVPSGQQQSGQQQSGQQQLGQQQFGATTP